MTINFKNAYIRETATIAGPFVIQGPLKGKFDKEYKDFYDNESTFERCEMKELYEVINILLKKTNKKITDINCLISADLMNQLTISNYTASKLDVPFLGIYNACASMAEGIFLASTLVDSNKMNNLIVTTSSHNMTAERQFRNPVEYGAPKPKTTTFTVSGATSVLIQKEKTNIKVDSATIGNVIDKGVKNISDMGSVMAPSAAFTLNKHLEDTKRDLNYYDLILTGDLGLYGKDIFKEYCKKEYNLSLGDNYDDSATMIYDYSDEKIYAGGSGPSCLPLVVYSDIIPKMNNGIIKKVLLIATGALMSPTTFNQKMSIPSVSHAISLEAIE